MYMSGREIKVAEIPLLIHLRGSSPCKLLCGHEGIVMVESGKRMIVKAKEGGWSRHAGVE